MKNFKTCALQLCGDCFSKKKIPLLNINIKYIVFYIISLTKVLKYPDVIFTSTKLM